MGARLTGLASATGLHAALLAALLAYEPSRSALRATAPIMVDWVLPPQAPTPPAPKIQPPKPRQFVRPLQIQRQFEPPPLVTAEAEAPSPVVAPPPPPPAPVEASAPVAAPIPFTPPVFDADYLLNPAPAYPRESRRNGEQGRVLLRVLVGATGAAEEVRLRASSGHPLLDQAAQDTVRRWKFVPARRGAQPVPAWVLIPISFRLRG